MPGTEVAGQGWTLYVEMGYGSGGVIVNHCVGACTGRGWGPLHDSLRRPCEARVIVWVDSHPEIVDCPAVTLDSTLDRHECTLENESVVGLHCDPALLSSCCVGAWRSRDASFCREPAVLVLL